MCTITHCETRIIICTNNSSISELARARPAVPLSCSGALRNKGTVVPAISELASPHFKSPGHQQQCYWLCKKGRSCISWWPISTNSWWRHDMETFFTLLALYGGNPTVTGGFPKQRAYNAGFEVHDDVIKWKHFPRNWPFVRGIHRSPVNSPHKGQWRFDVFFDLCLNKRLSKQSWGWWFEMPSWLLWRQCNVLCYSTPPVSMKHIRRRYIHVSSKHFSPREVNHILYIVASLFWHQLKGWWRRRNWVTPSYNSKSK